MILLLQAFFMVFIAEMGDKSQFLLLAMASKFKIRDIVIGTAAAICVLNAFAILVGTLIGDVLQNASFAISIVAGLAFFYFAFSSLKDDDGEEETVGKKGKFGAIATIFGTFVLAELGDKTQLTALTLAAGNGAEKGFDIVSILLVFIGSSLALFIADMLGLAVGYFLGKKLPSNIFAWISFAIFAVFGVVKLIDGFGESPIFSGMSWATVTVTAILSLAFAVMCFIRIMNRYQNIKSEHK